MTHLKITQNTTSTELVTNEIIEKLYDISKSNLLDNSSDLLGRLEATNAYDDAIKYLVEDTPKKYQNLYISVPENNRYIRFEDPNMITYLNYIGVGSNGHITKLEAANAESVATSLKTFDNVNYATLVTKFNELKYFTRITESKGGWTDSQSGNLWFHEWTALEEVDISNFTSLGHNKGYGWNDAFRQCTSLKKVIASSKLTKLGLYVFDGCTSLQSINVSSNTGSSKQLVDLLYVTEIGTNAFRKCSNIEYIRLSSNSVIIGNDVFKGCSKLKSINLDGVYEIGQSVFSADDLSYPPFTDMSVINFANLQDYGGTSSNNRFYALFLFPNTIKQIYLPKITTLKQGGYDNGGNNVTGLFIRNGFNNSRKSHDIIYFKNLLTIESGVFSGLTNTKIVINNSTVPTIIGSSGYSSDNSSTKLFYGTNSTVLDIYVPDSAVSDYKSAWSSISSNIHSISDLNNNVTYQSEELWIAAGKPIALIEDYMDINNS